MSCRCSLESVASSLRSLSYLFYQALPCFSYFHSVDCPLSSFELVSSFEISFVRWVFTERAVGRKVRDQAWGLVWDKSTRRQEFETGMFSFLLQRPYES